MEATQMTAALANEYIENSRNNAIFERNTVIEDVAEQ
jgi:hypothetical protein